MAAPIPRDPPVTNRVLAMFQSLREECRSPLTLPASPGKLLSVDGRDRGRWNEASKPRTPPMPVPPFAHIAQDLPSTVPFVGPDAQERNRARLFRARLGANESMFGPSPRAIEAMRAAAGEA